MAKAGEEDKYLVIKGPLTSADTELLGSLAIRLGYYTEVQGPGVFASLGEKLPEKSLPYSFEEIVSPDQFLSREHAEAFRAGYLGTEVREITAITAFGVIVQPAAQIQMHSPGHPKPEDFGLIVKTREDAGFPSLHQSSLGHLQYHTKQKANLVVQAGSLVDFMRNYRKPGYEIVGIGDKSEYFLSKLAHQLEAQMIQKS